MPEENSQLLILNQEIVACRKCPRLVRYREKVAREKRRAYREWTYWGKPVPGFGDAYAQLLILGLAPAAHGAEAEVAVGRPRLFGVYHPSQQNTQTGRVTPAMYSSVLRRIRRFLEK